MTLMLSWTAYAVFTLLLRCFHAVLSLVSQRCLCVYACECVKHDCAAQHYWKWFTYIQNSVRKVWQEHERLDEFYIKYVFQYICICLLPKSNVLDFGWNSFLVCVKMKFGCTMDLRQHNIVISKTFEYIEVEHSNWLLGFWKLHVKSNHICRKTMHH